MRLNVTKWRPLNEFHEMFRVYVQAQLYIGLIVMAAFVLFDTQMIMERCRAGSTDCIRHSLDLFFDLVSMFRRLLIILTQKVSKWRLLFTLLPFPIQFMANLINSRSPFFTLQEEREQRRRKNK